MTGVVYLGSVNHYIVDVDGGDTLTVLRQNLHGGADQLVAEGQRVDLSWQEEHVIDLTPSDGGDPGASHASAVSNEGDTMRCTRVARALVGAAVLAVWPLDAAPSPTTEATAAAAVPAPARMRASRRQTCRWPRRSATWRVS